MTMQEMPSVPKKMPLFLGGKPFQTALTLPVKDKFTGEVMSEVALADSSTILKAIELAHRSLETLAQLSHYDRKEILGSCVYQIKQRKEELAYLLCLEVGKTLKDARGEVGRLIDTFSLAQEETGRLEGQWFSLDSSQRAKHYQGFYKRFPVGLCSFISPFNFPLNLTAHKIAPAIAVGCPFILKPASRTPLTSLILGEILSNSALPSDSFSILPCSRDGADLFTTDDRIKLISFTGSPEVGWKIKERAGKKRVVLELGGNAACIVTASCNLKDAVARILIGAFSQNGQSCISVQRILVHHSIFQEFKDLFAEGATKLQVGNPQLPETDLGPLISESEAARLENWITDAVKAGATLLAGGTRKGPFITPTVLENVPPELPLNCEEAFGPVATLSSFGDFDEALAEVNRSRFGLQAGVFTRHLDDTFKAFEKLQVGGVVINEVPSWRSDAMPYGGIKDSGLGREGVRFAMEEMTELKSLVIRNL